MICVTLTAPYGLDEQDWLDTIADVTEKVEERLSIRREEWIEWDDQIALDIISEAQAGEIRTIVEDRLEMETESW